jgi:hypothetical protein
MSHGPDDLATQAFERDGPRCVMTGVKLNQLPADTDYVPILSHIIPNSIHGKVGGMVLRNGTHLLIFSLGRHPEMSGHVRRRTG